MVNFFVNQEYIKETLCINKDRPKLQCNGKCFLMQQLKENKSPRGKNDQFPPLEITKIEYVDLSNIACDDSLTEIIPSFIKEYPFHCLGNYIQVSSEIFHPPCV